ncbi:MULTISPECIES: hypothetical protein [Acinetobacter]|jgi:hypothetical protein|uniref:hypothetical protein n=1 Tax=Acinetobacter TaxID=469 RepID=UPI0002CEC370|nr:MULTISPECIES: hypothetical protein [Acinetobacter]MDN5648689.1 hypothetical protein [Acinetobacter sp.]ENU56398.1 hypothetical protein F981_04586 [Acinetobacter guillouiae CIP 63.46]EPH36883.1 hypothetical protein L291_1090 [Acinetobacter guillouiae MSP4-18]KAB0623419.1 hypothetical protein F7P82_21910 [Acinetobacter guillouiae]KEC82465.1 hypothetical protein DT74_02690 [Acinetobacter sp. ETR1]
MSCYITLHFSNSLSPEYDFNDADTPYFASKNLIPLFWLALFSKENIHLYESHIEDEYSYYYLQTNRLNAIYNFQKYFGIWIHFGQEALQLSQLFLDFLKSQSQEYIILRLDDLFAMAEEPDTPNVYSILIEMLNFYPQLLKKPNLKKVKAYCYLALSVELYLEENMRNGLDADMVQFIKTESQTVNQKPKNQLKEFFSNLFNKL